MAKRKKVNIEFVFKCSPSILYNYISSPSGLSEWFAKDVDIKKPHYIFKWDGSEQRAELLKSALNKFVRFKWEDSAADEYFEMEISKDELTGDVSLIITDFCDESDYEGTLSLWDSQVHELKTALGS